MNRREAVLMFVAGCIASSLGGALLRPGEPALADVTKTAPREAFKAGSERNEATLREIADLLKKIDGRVERIEQAATRGAAPPARQ
jgi:hypothetical protein